VNYEKQPTRWDFTIQGIRLPYKRREDRWLRNSPAWTNRSAPGFPLASAAGQVFVLPAFQLWL
jgi:hypothetical protein